MPQEKVYDDVEVHDMNDLHRNRRTGVKKDAVQGESPVLWKALSVIIAMLAIVYDLSPVDVVPDAVPLFGWLDDVGFLVTATMNAVQQFTKDQNSAMVKILKYAKWFMVIAVVIAALLLGGLIAAIVALIVK